MDSLSCHYMHFLMLYRYVVKIHFKFIARKHSRTDSEFNPGHMQAGKKNKDYENAGFRHIEFKEAADLISNNPQSSLQQSRNLMIIVIISLIVLSVLLAVLVIIVV